MAVSVCIVSIAENWQLSLCPGAKRNIAFKATFVGYPELEFARLRGSAQHTPSAGKTGLRIAIEYAEFARVSALANCKGGDHSHPKSQRTQLTASWQRHKD
jgi:hypothetical protein